MAMDLSTLVGKVVRLDRGGPESKQGRVIAVGSDHLVLENEKEGIIYFNTRHLKSISQNTKEHSDYVEQISTEEPARYIEASNFLEVMQNMKHRWCQVNRGGHESVQGVMSDVFDDHILMVVNHELITILNYHIKSIGYVVKNENQEEKKDQEKENKNESKDKNKEESKDKRHESGRK